jgi:hypothetical protein
MQRTGFSFQRARAPRSNEDRRQDSPSRQHEMQPAREREHLRVLAWRRDALVGSIRHIIANERENIACSKALAP